MILASLPIIFLLLVACITLPTSGHGGHGHSGGHHDSGGHHHHGGHDHLSGGGIGWGHHHHFGGYGSSSSYPSSSYYNGYSSYWPGYNYGYNNGYNNGYGYNSYYPSYYNTYSSYPSSYNYGSYPTYTAIQDQFAKDAIVSDIIPRAPKTLLSVNYASYSASLGNELNRATTQTPPSLDWPIESGALYTIAMVDPDAPSRKHPLAREWRHWLVVNVKSKDVSSGRTLTSYQGPSPPSSSGLHRYVLLVYKQKAEITNSEWSDRNRPNWRVANFASKNQLGDPVAGNFFQVKG
uniref:Uncharacterized protein n=1 Tax=Plectus sambesii TaxID=2011161 RepID=A0A914VWK0_9BILA